MDDIPEQAIRSFERIHGVRVTVHDLGGMLRPWLAPDRFMHTDPRCLAVKALDDGEYCFELEVNRLRPEMAQTPDGRVHVCHAGFVEWVVPIFDKTRLTAVLFAGLRLPGEQLLIAIPMGRPSQLRADARKAHSGLATVADGEGADILEHLRQVAARLAEWTRDHTARNDDRSSALSIGPASGSGRRSIAIRRYIALNHMGDATLPGLANELSLSESRASHAVREECGATFQEMVTEARIKTAKGLLRSSGLSVTEAAVNSGFRDVAHFYRVFRRITGETPGQYRRRRES